MVPKIYRDLSALDSINLDIDRRDSRTDTSGSFQYTIFSSVPFACLREFSGFIEHSVQAGFPLVFRLWQSKFSSAKIRKTNRTKNFCI